MKLSQIAWQRSGLIIDEIMNHPFNLELSAGVLPRDRFAYYIEQDSIYLKDFARALAIIAAKAPVHMVRQFLKYSDFCFIAEQEIIHQFFIKTFNFSKTEKLSPASLCYTSFLLRICSNEPVEIGVAAILPCFWIYREVGLAIACKALANNPYIRWIETYTSPDFSATVDDVINIFDELAIAATTSAQEKMIDAFYKSTCLEWHFWNDSYNRKAFDDFAAK